MFKNMMWMTAGLGVGFLASKYSKDIKRLAKNCGLPLARFVLAAINYFYEKELLIK